jgi:hypothetical protein
MLFKLTKIIVDVLSVIIFFSFKIVDWNWYGCYWDKLLLFLKHWFLFFQGLQFWWRLLFAECHFLLLLFFLLNNGIHIQFDWNLLSIDCLNLACEVINWVHVLFLLFWNKRIFWRKLALFAALFCHFCLFSLSLWIFKIFILCFCLLWCLYILKLLLHLSWIWALNV